MLRTYQLRSEVKEPIANKVIELNMEHYKKLWKPNDLWRLASISHNLNIHIDYVYDLVVRFMKNVIKKYPDGKGVSFLTVLGNNVPELADMAGWPLEPASKWVDQMLPYPVFDIFDVPHDGFLRADGNSGKLNVDDIDTWKYYIENSDPNIGQGQWTYIPINSGPISFIPEIKMPEEYREILNFNVTDPMMRPHADSYGDLSETLAGILKKGIGDQPWTEIVYNYNIDLSSK